jgi:hypothetical protein
MIEPEFAEITDEKMPDCRRTAATSTAATAAVTASRYMANYLFLMTKSIETKQKQQ